MVFFIHSPLEAGDKGKKPKRKGETAAMVCGNGVVEVSGAVWEECDDGNLNNGDGCSCACALEPAPGNHCGNRVCEAGEMDPVPTQVGDEVIDLARCPQDCCGKTVCQTPPHRIRCGDCVVESTETCDDGNLNNGDGCDSLCSREQVCGNGLLSSGEECDDGNTMNGDRCSAECRNEPPPSGGGPPSCEEAMRRALREIPDFLEEEIPECARECRCGDECPTPVWAVTIPGRFHTGFPQTLTGGQDIALDSEGNVYVVGTLYTPDGSVSPESEKSNIVLYKFDECGVYQWHRVINGWSGWTGSGFDYGLGVTVDTFDNVYITGGVQQDKTPPNYHHILIRKYDSAGNELATRYYEGTYEDHGRSLAINSRGRLFVTGVRQGASTAPLDFWANHYTSDLSPVATETGLPMTLSGSRPGLNMEGNGVVVLPTGEVYFFGSDGEASLNAEVVVLKYTAAGDLDRSFGVEGKVTISHPERGLWGRDIAVDAAGNIYLTGRMRTPSWRTNYIWVTKLHATGIQAGSPFPLTYPSDAGRDYLGDGIAVAGDGSFVVVGWGTIQGIPGPRCLILKYNVAGELTASREGIPGCFTLGGVTISGDESIYVTGQTPEGGIWIRKYTPTLDR